jgi:hypothetical protein
MTNQDLLLSVMAGFVVVAAIALVIQAGLLFGIYRTTKVVQEQTATLVPQAKHILSLAETTLQESRKHVVEITGKANELMDSAKAQFVKIDSLVTDATARAKNQVERAEMVVDDTISRVHESVSAVHHGILVPVRQANAVAAGVRTAVAVFLRGGRPNVAEATQDTEMFI